MHKPFSLAKRSRYPIVFLSVFGFLVFLIFFIIPETKRGDAYLPATAIAAGFAYFLYSQHIQETKLFIELFKQFNKKYDSLNEALNKIANQKQVTVLSQPDKQFLFDYFNLCAEEYLYYKTGYIDIEVWQSWLKGMNYFADVRHIRDLWSEELSNGSYYGFTLELLPKSNDSQS
ncbi:MAG: hypothetical protein CFE38_02740 [Comamonadaceae bacterium PBBC1]|jgi:hypothetical protein|uniref:hypothetical protein n=1 Tax=Limnohabitans sp. 2KL-3 TaxID=1100700 RepID=UPI000ACE34BE|nr:hypothetical protein [Limnohabitans sp. 2KL-3]OYU13208.1 MAG: hypothetical protein CFE38_02740 [Comamonadaceae bacterium PBBC1]